MPRTATKKPAAPRYSAPVTAKLLTETVGVQLQVPAVKNATEALRAQAHALVLSTAYRLAAEIVTLNVDVGAQIAMPEVRGMHNWCVWLQLEAVAGTRDTVLLALIADACQRLGITITKA